MSGFDENPFGPPTIDNPFADPAVQQVASNTSNVQKGLEDYNPFADQPTPVVNRGEPAVMQPSNQPQAAPAYTRSAQQSAVNMEPSQITTAEFQRRQEELERKAEELNRREEELRNGTANIRRNNWPPLPEKCCFQPCFYQDINVDIPSEFQRIVRNLYYLWMFHTLVMATNLLGGMALMFHSADFTTFGLGLLYLLMFTPFSFLCWFRPAYKAFRNDSSFNFMVFFFVFFFQLIVTVIQTIGMPGTGTCGLIIAISCFDKTASGTVLGVFILLITIGFGVAAAGDLILISKIHKIYRSSGASFAKAQQEFTTEFMRNQHVQGAASNAAAAAINAQLNSNRY
uniref:Secretory carrier-associated membrane protein n=1 Tax=Xenopsylla cheopis TaxID=163159 RepID=A0A6M2DDQ2_XENCH